VEILFEEESKTERFQNVQKSQTPFHQLFFQNNPSKIKDKPEQLIHSEEFFHSLLNTMVHNRDSVKETIRDEVLMSSSFAQFIITSDTLQEGIYVVGLMDESLTLEIGGYAQIIFLSSYTITKTQIKHKDITLEHFLLLQKLLDIGEVIKEGRPQYQRHLVFYMKEDDDLDQDKYLACVVKSTVTGDELYLQTLYHTSTRELLRSRKRGKIVRSSLILRI